MGYRSWIAWPYCWQNPGPSSLWSTIPAAWKVSLSCKDWEDHVGFDCLKKKKRRRFNSVLVCWMFTETVKTPEGENMEHPEGSIKVFFRNQIEVKAGRGRFLAWPITLAWSWWNYHVFFLSSPPSSRIQSTSWTSTSSSVSSQQTATSHMVTDKDNYNKLSYVKRP